MMKLDSAMLKGATFARHYGASELMLATMTGQYPPPHYVMDCRAGQHELVPTENWLIDRCKHCGGLFA